MEEADTLWDQKTLKKSFFETRTGSLKNIFRNNKNKEIKTWKNLNKIIRVRC